LKNPFSIINLRLLLDVKTIKPPQVRVGVR